jgi:hypothetical protein
MQAQGTICRICGSDAVPLEVEMVGAVGAPNEIFRLDAWILCPKCGPQLNSFPDNGQKGTIDFICPISPN